jgi:hypothetical protein
LIRLIDIEIAGLVPPQTPSSKSPEAFGGCGMSSLTSPQARSRALQRIMHTLRVSPLRGGLQDVVLEDVSK